MGKRLLVLALALTGLAVVVTGVQAVALRFHNPPHTAMMRYRVREAAAKEQSLKIKQTWVLLEDIPPVLKAAVIAAEDEKFYEHHGFDWDALKQAYQRNEKTGKVKRGGSTISQQLAKNLYLSPKRSYLRKFREAYITLQIEWVVPKDRILELYLNCIEFGPGIFGVEEGAKYHFRKSVKALSVDECCRLAAIIPSPLRYKVTGNYVAKRAAVLRRIVAGAPPDEKEDSSANSPNVTGSDSL